MTATDASARGRPLRTAALALVTLVATVAAGPLALAHGNHVSAGPQVVTDEVVVESTFLSRDGHLVVHRDDGGVPGEVVGHASLERGYHENLAVGLDAVPEDGTTLWLVLHEDDGDGTFDPEDDPAVESFGSLAGTRVTVRPGPTPVYVTAPSETARDVADGTVRVDRVAAAEDGYLLLRAVEAGRPGRVVGSTAVEAGLSENVTVDLDEEYLEEQPDYFGVVAVLATENAADGKLTGVVSVGGEPVSTRVSLRTTGDEPGVDVVTTERQREGSASGGTLAQPGVGVVAGLAAVTLAVLVVARRRD